MAWYQIAEDYAIKGVVVTGILEIGAGIITAIDGMLDFHHEQTWMGIGIGALGAVQINLGAWYFGKKGEAEQEARKHILEERQKDREYFDKELSDILMKKEISAVQAEVKQFLEDTEEPRYMERTRILQHLYNDNYRRN